MNERTGVLWTLPVAAILAFVLIGEASSSDVRSVDKLEWQFQVLLDNEAIGFHRFEVDDEDEIRRVRSEASFNVKVLFFTAYRYRHQYIETWQNNCLLSINAQTDDNGEKLKVHGAVQADGFALEDADLERRLPACIMSYAYWNPAILSAGRLLNSQTGRFDSVVTEYIGQDSILIDGQQVTASRYRIQAKDAKPITVWYSADSYLWLALESLTEGDRVLRYQATRLPSTEKFHSADITR